MAFLDPFRTKVQACCVKYRVSELYAFGSVLREDFGPESDVDFLVELDWTEESELADRFLGLKQELTELLERPVDLVCYSAIRNPVFRQSVEESKEAIYAA
jgi:hypothetical protein